MGSFKINYDGSKKVFWVKINSGIRYEKNTIEELTRELTRLGVKWKLSRDAARQVEAFKLKKQ